MHRALWTMGIDGTALCGGRSVADSVFSQKSHNGSFARLKRFAHTVEQGISGLLPKTTVTSGIVSGDEIGELAGTFELTVKRLKSISENCLMCWADFEQRSDGRPGSRLCRGFQFNTGISGSYHRAAE